MGGMSILVTGGAGFIGSAVCRYLVDHAGSEVLNIDKLTYAANLNPLAPLNNSLRYHFLRADICDRSAMDAAFANFRPDAVIHLAAERPCRSLDHAVGRFYRDQYCRNL